MNVADAVSHHARERPFAVAIAEGGRVVHYQTLDHAVWRAAVWLKNQGIRPGDIVGISLPNTALHVATIFGLIRMGAVVLELPLTDPAVVRTGHAERFGLVAVIGEGEEARLPGLPLLAPDPAWFEPSSALSSDPPLRHPGGTAPFRLILSSGTTGEPKGLTYGHDAWLSSEAMDAPYNRFAVDDRYLMSIPPSIAIGLSYCMRIVVCGGMIVIPPADIDPDRYFDTIDRYGITRLVFTPSGLYQILLHAPPDTPRLPGLRQLLALTATVPETLRSEVRKRLSPNLVVRYSTNEFGTLTYADAETQAGHPETVGRPIRGVDVEVVDAAGTPLPAGETGLIRARGRPFPHRYFRNPEATGKVFRDGWYYPGDLGCFHPDGALFLKGRADDLMNFQGLKIFPADIENILLQHPGVAEAAAFPLESAQRQDLPAAVVVLRDPAVTPGQLIAFCRERLGARAPAYVATAAGMPRNSSGKVLKRELAKIVEARLQQRGHVL